MTYDSYKTTPRNEERFIADIIFALEPSVYDHVEIFPDSTKETPHFSICGEEMTTEPHYDEDGNVDPIRTACLIDDLAEEIIGRHKEIA